MYLYVLYTLKLASQHLSSLFESLVCAKRRILLVLFVRDPLVYAICAKKWPVEACVQIDFPCQLLLAYATVVGTSARRLYLSPNCNTYYTYLSNSTVSTGVDEQGVAVSKLFKTLGPPCHCRALLKDALVHDEGACNQLVFSFNICWMSNCWIRSAVTWLLISLLKLAASSNFNSSLGSKLVNVVAATAAAQNCVADAHNLARYHTCCHTSSSFALALSICECLS